MKILMNTFNTPTYTSPPLPLLVKMATSALDYKFKLEPEESLKCFLCRKIATDPKQHDTCGQLFCEACLEEAGLKTPCAHCKGESPGYFSDARSKYKQITKGRYSQGKEDNKKGRKRKKTEREREREKERERRETTEKGGNKMKFACNPLHFLKFCRVSSR